MKPIDLIEHILLHHQAPTVIIVCSSREAFLESVQSSLELDNPNGESTETGETGSLHPLLIPSIHQLATSRTVDMAFAPTLPHLRAYLATYAPGKASMSTLAAVARPGPQISMLAVYGLLELHRATTEHSVQGLSRTLAIAAETANQRGMRLTLIEPTEDLVLPTTEAMVDPETVAPSEPWAEQ
ncbi:MAG: hypothetical protein L6R39_007670, partial [Caloplaca ligustica]